LLISSKNSKYNLTIEDNILLHLLENNFDQDEYIVLDSITEKGIQSSINCGLGYISRILKKNEEQGYIFRKLMRIENGKRKQYAFFLTKEGLKLAEKLRKINSDQD
jgi:DNA-binding PadR family transcriptional regulator